MSDSLQPIDYSLPGLTQLGHNAGAFLLTRTVKNLPTMQETWVQSVDWEEPLGEGMATHSSILKEPGRLLQSIQSRLQSGYGPTHRELDVTERQSTGHNAISAISAGQIMPKA